VTARGVCWSLISGNAVATGPHTTNGSGTGTFTSSITGLVANATYYVRAYATTAAGTAYGDQVSFKTTSGTKPTVTTTTASSVRNDRAQVGGNVTSSGSATVTERGVVYAKHSNVTTADTKRSSGTGTGSFSSSITGLDWQTMWYVKAYATNSAGTSYGSEIGFQPLKFLIFIDSLATVVSPFLVTYYCHTENNPGLTSGSRGIVWNTTGSPQYGVDPTWTSLTDFSIPEFTVSTNAMSPNTFYYAIPWAYVDPGEGPYIFIFGSQIYFTT
jgi:hypothetical protein